MRVAVLGTGIMGQPIARNIASAGHEVVAWNRTRERAEPLSEHGVEVADQPAGAIEGADLVLTILSDADAVRSAVGGAVDAFGEDAVWAQMSTVGLVETEELYELAKGAGVIYVDCPVLGTKQPAEEGKLTVLAGGPADARATCDSAFDAIAAKTVWMDEVGDGQRLKMVANSWVLGLTEALAETMALAEGLGVEQQSFLDLIEGAPMDSPYAQMKGKLILEGEFPTSFSLELAAKDARLVVEAAEQAGLSLPLHAAVRDQMASGVEAGHGEKDMAATYNASAKG